MITFILHSNAVKYHTLMIFLIESKVVDHFGKDSFLFVRCCDILLISGASDPFIAVFNRGGLNAKMVPDETEEAHGVDDGDSSVNCTGLLQLKLFFLFFFVLRLLFLLLISSFFSG